MDVLTLHDLMPFAAFTYAFQFNFGLLQGAKATLTVWVYSEKLFSLFPWLFLFPSL